MKFFNIAMIFRQSESRLHGTKRDTLVRICSIKGSQLREGKRVMNERCSVQTELRSVYVLKTSGFLTKYRADKPGDCETGYRVISVNQSFSKGVEFLKNLQVFYEAFEFPRSGNTDSALFILFAVTFMCLRPIR